ncbi:3958_t:CDS:1, partial [Cetraspora pellucida]
LQINFTKLCLPELKINVTDDDSSNKTINDEMNSPSTKCICRATSKNAKEILTRLLAHTTFPNDDQLLYDVLHELQDIESGWTKE